MKKVLVLGAGGQIARWVIDMLANNGKVEMNLFLRHPSKIKRNAPKNAHVVQGDVLNMEQLKHAIDGQDITLGKSRLRKGLNSARSVRV